jgi:hypothetical protein
MPASSVLPRYAGTSGLSLPEPPPGPTTAGRMEPSAGRLCAGLPVVLPPQPNRAPRCSFSDSGPPTDDGEYGLERAAVGEAAAADAAGRARGPGETTDSQGSAASTGPRRSARDRGRPSAAGSAQSKKVAGAAGHDAQAAAGRIHRPAAPPRGMHRACTFCHTSERRGRRPNPAHTHAHAHAHARTANTPGWPNAERIWFRSCVCLVPRPKPNDGTPPCFMKGETCRLLTSSKGVFQHRDPLADGQHTSTARLLPARDKIT